MVRPCNCCPPASACGLQCAPLVTQCGGPFTMSKALFGHVGGPDPRMVSEMRRLQQRVRDLESELARLQNENDVLAAGLTHDEDVLVLDPEPALTCRSQGARTQVTLVLEAQLSPPPAGSVRHTQKRTRGALP